MTWYYVFGIAGFMSLATQAARIRSLASNMSASLMGFIFPWKGMADEDDFWNEPSLSTYRFSIANMLLYTSQSLYEHIDVNSTPNKEYVPFVSHKQKGSIHVANAAMAA